MKRIEISPPMRLTAATRVFNEEDIIEPFIRHHAAYAQAHVLLDNGSTDRTLTILAALRREGFNLTVYQNRLPVFVEPIENTALLDLALGVAETAWVLFLDCDEFIDDRAAPRGLAAALAEVPSDVRSVQLGVMDYLAATDQTADALNCVERFVLRKPAPEPGRKIFVRRPGDGSRLAVAAGAHFLIKDGQAAPGLDLQTVGLAHFPERSAIQFAAKAIIGRLKVLATGHEGADSGWSAHYNAAFEALRDDPALWLDRAEATIRHRARSGLLVHDPAPYHGGALIHTSRADPAGRAIALLLRFAESQARAHGRLMDGVPGVSPLVIAQARSLTRVL